MAFQNNLNLFIISSLLIAFRLARSDLSPNISPSLSPDSSPESVFVSLSFPSISPAPSSGLLAPSPSVSTTTSSDEQTPSPSPSMETPQSHISFPPSSISDPPLTSISPNAAPPTESNLSFEYDIPLFISPSADVSPKVKEICDKTDHPSLCLATVVPFLDGKDDAQSVLEVAISASDKLSKYTLSLIEELAEKPETPPQLLLALKDCKGSYNAVGTTFQSTVDAFSSRDIDTVNMKLSAVITNVGDCEDKLTAAGENSLLYDVAEKLTNMTSNCLAISNLLK